MTILGKHTVAETRDNIRATEFRVNQIINLFGKVVANRIGPRTPVQDRLDLDLAAFVRRWTDTRDRVTDAMTSSIISNNVSPDILPAEESFIAIQNAVSRDEPRLVDIQQRLDTEAVSQGLAPVDLSKTPAQDSPDADFAALGRLDKAITKVEEAKKAAKDVLPSVPSLPQFPSLPSLPKFWWAWGLGIGAVGIGLYKWQIESWHKKQLQARLEDYQLMTGNVGHVLKAAAGQPRELKKLQAVRTPIGRYRP